MTEAAAVVLGFTAYGAALVVVLSRLAGDPVCPRLTSGVAAASGAIAAWVLAVRWMAGG